MAAGDQIRVQWDDDAIARLVAGPDGPVAAMVTRRCIAVQNAATQLCPVDTGRLRASISHTVGVDDRGVVGYVGSNVEYAPHVEFGTENMPAQPFLRPALDAARGDL